MKQLFRLRCGNDLDVRFNCGAELRLCSRSPRTYEFCQSSEYNFHLCVVFWKGVIYFCKGVIYFCKGVIYFCKGGIYFCKGGIYFCKGGIYFCKGGIYFGKVSFILERCHLFWKGGIYFGKVAFILESTIYIYIAWWGGGKSYLTGHWNIYIISLLR